MTISQKGIQNISAKLQSEKIDKDSREGKLGLSPDQKIIYEFNQYSKDPISYRVKYGDAGVNILLQQINDLKRKDFTITKQGSTVTKRKNKKGGRIKYQSKGKVTSDRDANIRLAWRYAKAEAGSGDKEVSEQDFYQALKRVKSSPEMVRKRLNELQAMGAAGKSAQPTNTGAVGKLQRLQQGLGMQYGGMADMSAAPMIKQPQRKKRKASGFRTKYSKGGGVRASKYKL